MKRLISFIFIHLSLLFVSAPLYATTVDEITTKLDTPMVIVTKVLIFCCYVVGAILIFAAIAQYRNHRQSPKLVPLTTPVLLLILGVGLLFIPYITTLVQDTSSAAERQKREGRAPVPTSIYDETYDDSDEELGPGYLPEDDPVEPYEEPRGGSNGGHWSDGYR